MPRVTPVEGRRAPLLLRLLDLAARWRVGLSLTPLNVLAHNPGFLLPYLGLTTFVSGRSALDPHLRSLATHLVAERNGCGWCLDFGLAEARRLGVDEARLQALPAFASSPLFTARERAALALADAMVASRGHPSDDVFEAARHHFSDRELVELVLAVAAENLFNWMNGTLGVEPQGFCALVPARAQAHAQGAHA